MVSRTVVCSLLLLCLPISLLADDDEPLFNRVNLQAQAQMEIPNDEIQIILAVEKEGADAAKLATDINQTMEWALARSGKDDSIRVRTLSYNTNPVYDKKTVIGWRASQQLELKGQAIAKITALSGELQKKLQIKSMRFSPSAETRKKYEDELIITAVRDFKQRVELLKSEMEASNVRIIHLNINTGGGVPGPVYHEARAMSLQADMAPAVEAGTSTLTVTVNGSVQYF